jgi:N-acetyl-anhydromuramyl-L-alanine amidase AmpD
VRLKGDGGSGTLLIETLNRVQATIPALSDGGQPTLCDVTPGAMLVCPADETHTGEEAATIDVLSNVNGGSGTPSGALARGTAITLWEFVHDGAGHGKAVALITVDGHEHFIADSDVCFATSYPNPSPVTTLLRMHTQWKKPNPSGGMTMASSAAAPGVYRPRSPDMVARVVVHNTEEPFTETLTDFTSGKRGTSAHVVIDRDGTMYRVVEDQFAAYHAGASPDGMGGFNNATLGVEVVAYDGSLFGGGAGDANYMSEAQTTSLVSLIDAWMKKYDLQLTSDTLHNSASSPGYAYHEYASSALTIHRLTKANRGTDCPKFLFEDSPDGDEAFFRWRQRTFGN